MKNTVIKYDLEEKTSKFGSDIIKFCKSIKIDRITNPLIDQLIRSGTSVGANYLEANGASSKKILGIKFIYARKNLRRQDTGSK